MIGNLFSINIKTTINLSLFFKKKTITNNEKYYIFKSFII